MTDIYVELGGKKAIAWSLEWPGWCRIRACEAEAVKALIDTEARYRLIARRAGQEFAPGDLVVVERLQGNANTAWGVPSVMASVESRPIDATTAQRNVALLRASWDMLEEVADVLSKPSIGKPLVASGWNASYAVRRMAWHVVDHLWEIEDRRS